MADNDNQQELVEHGPKPPAKARKKAAPKQDLVVADDGRQFDVNPGELMKVAIESGQPMETVSAVIALRRELKDGWARGKFYESLARFQEICPRIPKGRTVLNKDKSVRYRYASLDDIVAAVKGPLGECGFSWLIKTQQDHERGLVTATVVLTHVAGHSEESTFQAEVDNSAHMSLVQKYGSANSYAKRYAFSNATGILTSDEDDDAQSTGLGAMLNAFEELQELRECQTVDSLVEKAKKLAESPIVKDDKEKRAVLRQYMILRKEELAAEEEAIDEATD